MKIAGLTPRPWVKLWRDEHGLFGRLPLFARALAAEILKVTEMDGTIVLGGREPVEALALALGADVGDRRLLRKYLPMLVEVGYVVRDGDVLRLPAWYRRQEIDAPANRTRTERESNANETRVEREPDANRTRTEREIEAKPAEALDGTPSALLLEEEGEGEGDREISAAAPPAPPAPSHEERIVALSERYPADLIAAAYDGCRMHRASARIAPAVWRATLEKLDAHPLDVVVRALGTFVDRYGAGARDERYLLGIVRGEAREHRARGLTRGAIRAPTSNADTPDGLDTWDPLPIGATA